MRFRAHRYATPPEPEREEESPDPIMERIERDRKPGEIESGMMSGSDEAEISATERFEGELSPEEALAALDPARFGDEVPHGGWPAD